MAQEIFGMKVNLQLIVENLNKVKKQVADGLKNIPAGIGAQVQGMAGAQAGPRSFTDRGAGPSAELDAQARLRLDLGARCRTFRADGPAPHAFATSAQLP